MQPATFIVCGILVPALAGLAAAGPEVRLEGGRFVARGWPAAARPSDVFQVFVDSNAADVPPLAGSYIVEDGALVFQPRFPLEAGLRYRAVLASSPPIVANFEIPKQKPHEAARVESVFPSADRVPENLLKLYVHFTAPMSRAEVYHRVHLLDARGTAVELPFLELEQELWDAGGRRLTLLFDPGRIKRGLVPLSQIGPAVKDGGRYTLVIDRGWRDAQGTPLTADFRKEFTVSEPDRTPPDPGTWRISAPRAGHTGPLVVDFHEPMDHALIERMLAVKDASGRSVAGAVSIEQRETLWRFTPERAWQAGSYVLAIDSALEDLAGNRIGRPFDVDLAARSDLDAGAQIRMVPFRVR